MPIVEKISGNVVDVINETVQPATLLIANGKIIEIKKSQKQETGFIIPGFVDAHVHIESSMLPPAEFARYAVIHGTIATVSDPHEIGNVLGIAGVEYMRENAKLSPMKIYFGAPSCVPTTSFETAGAHICSNGVEFLLSGGLKYLSEVMNFPGVIHEDPEMMAKIAIAKRLRKKLDGHAPKLSGMDLRKYRAADIQTDHECTTLDEAREKIALGMKILIREGSAARNFEALFPLLLESPEACMLCSDDLHPDSLFKGHINLLVQKAVANGADVMKVLRCASLNPIQHYGLEVGLLQEGDPADFIQVQDLTNFSVLQTVIDGRCVAKNQRTLLSHHKSSKVNHFNAEIKRPSDFEVKAQEGLMKVMVAMDGQLITSCKLVTPHIRNGLVLSDPTHDILKIAVVNRYHNKLPSVAFIKNFGLKKGAIASSVAHDSHNIIAVGVSDEDLCKAVNCIIGHKGGIAVVDENTEQCLPLPIAGLMSDKHGEEVAEEYLKLETAAKKLGSPLQAPFMTLSFMALLVIPELKLSDLGLFDEKTFSMTSLFD